MAEKQLAYRASGNDEFFADDDPLAELARIVGFEPRPAAQAAPAAQRQEPAFNLEDELLREFERYDTPRMSPANDISVPPEQPVLSDQAPVSPPAEPVRAEPKFEEPPQPVAPVKPTMGARDLIDELEMSIAPALQAVMASPPPAARIEPPVAPPVVKPTPQSAAATVRLPLANFTLASPSAPREQPVPPVAPAVPETSRVDTAFDFEPAEAADVLPVYEPQPVVAVEPTPVTATVPESPKTPNVDVAALSAEIDSLLADVDRYPVPSRSNAPAAMEEPEFEDFGSSFTEPSAAPVAAATAPQPITFDTEDPFAGQDFEFDLADIEMELAGLDFADAAKSAPAKQPVLPAAPAIEPVVSPATPVAPVAAAVIPQPIQAEPAPVVPAARTAAPVFDADQMLPFDPTEISDTEERVENFEGSHVPHLPAIEPEEPIVVQPEYDFDIDSEMASLLGTPAKDAAPEPMRSATAAFGGAAAAASWSKNTAAQPAAAAAKQPIEEFDEFERALEEDFRRSYREAANPVENVARMTLNPAAGNRRPARPVRNLATAAAVIAVLGLGAYGVYGWVRHGSPISTFSGEPRVITADANPVKVAPENPGGTVVPNQDKAVYDRVAGDGTAAPKQKELVSSNEQPVDVVQKTLIPESVSPDDDSGDQVTSTPVGETEDPRLLPNQNGGNTNVAANDDGQVPAVSPRKVRTMIVKPDGSLVARDEPAVDNTTTAAAKPVVNNQAASADLRPTTTTTPPAATTTPPVAAQPQPVPPQPATDGDAASAESTPIRVVKTTPLPTARPEQTKASAAAAPAAAAPAAVAPHQTQPKAQPQPQQVASASPAPTRAAPAAAASSAGGYGVQIASLPSEADAQKSQANLKVKFASVIGNHPLEIRKADIAGKGTYYRVRVVAGSKDEAAAICERYRTAGGTCLISK